MTRDDHDNERGKRPFVKRDRPRDDRGSDRPRRFEGESRGDKPRGFESRGDKPRGFEPRGDKPRGFDMSGADEGERIAKRLARVGIASRREAESMIAAGRVAVNGKVLTSPAVNVLRTDKITVDNKVLQQAERTRLWLYHKPAGLVTTNRDPEGRPTVFDALPEELPRVLSVGRLDINTEGLLLLTNDGGLSRVLELPATGWLRRYRVRAHGTVTQAQLDELKNGIAVDGVFYGSVEATLEREQGSNVWLNIGLREGKNREVKNILGALGLAVSRLIRVSFGPFQLGDLEEGAVREIRGRTLREQLGEKLVEDSGADFEAPIYNEFSNESVQGELPHRMQRFDAYEDRSTDTEGEGRSRYKSDWISSSGDAGGKGRGGGKGGFRGGSRGAPRGEGDRGAPRSEGSRGAPRGEDNRGEFRGAPRGGEDRGAPRGEGRSDFRSAPRDGERKPFQRDRDGKSWREDGLSRLSTSAPRSGGFDKPRGGRSEKGGEDKFGSQPQRPRGVNVWMAPGAKAYNSTTKPVAGEDRRRSRRDGVERPAREDGGRGYQARPENRDGYKRQGFRRDEEGRDGFKREGFRSENRRDNEGGERPAREERRFSGERSYDKKPYGDRKPFGDRPSGDKPFRGKPEGGRGGKPSGDRSFGKGPHSGKPSGNRPSGPRGSGPRGSGPRGDKR
ncbi:pseudouridine synthase [Pseudochrobactrum sp. sp1633]|uniref:pseudouridine synthase n=1 Tax=Pseudochrobactrum sp. sp1633 TaxID=3036706 RepID=UPI0025A50EFF|nr:pseudouridine synthase [Pseudochrobactrum sp. sp1633]MDM8345368.1 pseudouridine synthase [Pseudochrobactrum sp. sp1633]HWD12781.1 pseudouridine synthase [Pseudochrobactrum sp.]